MGLSFMSRRHGAKQAVRQFVLPDGPINNGIWLAAGKSLCVNHAYQQGLLDTARSVTLVEKDEEVFKNMVASAPPLKSVRCLRTSLEHLRVDDMIDYGFFDFFGGLTEPVSRWMSLQLSPNLGHGATIGITQIVAYRGNKLIPAQEKHLSTSQGTEIRRCYGDKDLRIQCLLLLLHRIFHQWEFCIEEANKPPYYSDDFKIPKYQDKQHFMMVFKLVDFRKPTKKAFRFLPL